LIEFQRVGRLCEYESLTSVSTVGSASSTSLSATPERDLDAAKVMTSLISSFTDRNKPKDGSSQKSASVKGRWTPEDEARLVELKKKRDLSNEDMAKMLNQRTASVASSRTDGGDHGDSAKQTTVVDNSNTSSEDEDENGDNDATNARRSGREAVTFSSSVTSPLSLSILVLQCR